MTTVNLIATFYGERHPTEPLRDALNPLYAALAEHLQPAAIWQQHDRTMPLPDDWAKAPFNSSQLLYRHYPTSYHDTQFIQLALEEPISTTIPDAWQAMRQRLEVIITSPLLNLTWGYSLIYFAAASPDKALYRAAHTLRPSLNDHPLDLATSHVGLGQLTLIERALDTRANVYVALTTPAQEADFFYQTLYSPQAPWLAHDLVAHKAYFHLRQFPLNPRKAEFEAKLITMRQTCDELLNNLNYDYHRLTQLSQHYAQLSQLLREFSRLHTALMEQDYNYQRTWPAAHSTPVWQYHADQIRTGARQFELLLTEGRSTLNTTHTILTLLQTQLSHTQNRLAEHQQTQQQHLQDLLAIVSLAFAIPQVLTQDVIKSFNSHLAYRLNYPLELQDPFALMLEQLIIIGVIGFCLHTYQKRRKSIST